MRGSEFQQWLNDAATTAGNADGGALFGLFIAVMATFTIYWRCSRGYWPWEK